jgi:predicted Zn-dependent protease
MDRHPVDYYAAGHTAAALFAARDPDAMRFLNRALTLHPTHSGLHLLAARMLFAGDRAGQAQIEYSLAVRYEPHPAPIVAEVLARYRDAGQAAGALPVDHPRFRMVVELVAAERPDVAYALVKRAVAADPRNVAHLRMLTDFAHSQGQLADARRAAATAFDLAPSAETGAAYVGLLIATAEIAAAERLLGELLRTSVSTAQNVNLLTLLAEVYARTGRWADAKGVLLRAKDMATERATLAGLHHRLAAVERAMKNEHQAEWEQARGDELAAERAGD